MTTQAHRPLVVDADGHVREPRDPWERNLPMSTIDGSRA